MNHPNLIRFDTLDPAAPIAFLRAAGLKLTERLLTRKPLRGSLFKVADGGLLSLLGARLWRFQTDADHVQFRYSTKGKPEHLCRRLLTRKRSGDFQPIPALELSHVRLAKSGSKPPLWWSTELGKTITYQFGRSQPHFFPGSLSELLEMLAWSDFRFKKDVQTLIADHIYNHTVYQPGNLHITGPAPRFFWLLILAAANGGIPASLPFPEADRQDRLSALDQLKAMAHHRLQTAGWAGFWEQWLIMLTLRQEAGATRGVHGLLTALSPALQRELRGLPLLQHLARDLFKRADPQCRAAAPRWEAQCPPWCRQLITHRRPGEPHV